MLNKKLQFILFQSAEAGKSTQGSLLTCQPTVELTVGVVENIIKQVVNNQAHSWLTIAHMVASLYRYRNTEGRNAFLLSESYFFVYAAFKLSTVTILTLVISIKRGTCFYKIDWAHSLWLSLVTFSVVFLIAASKSYCMTQNVYQSPNLNQKQQFSTKLLQIFAQESIIYQLIVLNDV